MAGHRKPARKGGARDRHALSPARREEDLAAAPAPAARNAERIESKRPDEATSKRKPAKRKLSESKEAVRRRNKYAEDPDYRERTLAENKKRYAEDAEFREKVLASQNCYHNANKEEINAARRERYATDPDYAALCRGRRRNESVHAHRLWTQYGITIADYNALLARQNGVCRICKTKPAGRRLAVDHCHATNTIRRLLCNNCNLGVGNFKDNPALMREAAKYVEEEAARVGKPGCLYVRKPGMKGRGARRTKKKRAEKVGVGKAGVGKKGVEKACAGKKGVAKDRVEADRVTSRRGRRARSGSRRG